MSDEAIVRLIQSLDDEGVRAGMERLLEAYGEKIEAAVRLFSPGVDAHGREDIRQDALLRIRRSIRGRYQHEGKLWAYIKSLIRGVATDAYRRQKRINQRTVIFADPGSEEAGAPEPTAPLSELPDETVMHTEQTDAVRAALDRLRPPCREVIDLHYQEDLKYKEIAEQLGVPMGTVASRLARCLDELGALLGKM